ncbi:MAG: glycosyl hydrolase family 18 protein [Lachnospiraceae bacterium]|nr:glycosyl hydrolase family 18 protein [Lachnospiraceae bacterium]
MEKKNRKKSPVVIVLLLMVLILVASIAVTQIQKRIPSNKRMDAESYFHLQDEDEVAITADGSVSESTGKMIDGNIYLDYESIASLINPSFFYEEDTKTLIITTPKDTKTIDLSKSGASADNRVQILDGTMYVSLDMLQKWSDIHVETFENPNRVYITTDFTHVEETVSAQKSVAVRNEPSIKAPILLDLENGSSVKVLDVDADGGALDGKKEGWTRVVSEGIIGYVQDESLTDSRSVEDDHTSAIGSYHDRAAGAAKINMAFHQTTSQASNDALPDAIRNVSGVNVIAPTWFFLNSDAGAIDSLASKTYVDTAHAAGLKVWAVLNDFDGGVNSGKSTAAALSTYKNRQAMITAVLSGLRTSGADGLNVDFEKVTKTSAADFLEFIRELSAAIRKEGYVLSVDNYVPTFTSFMGRGEQARVADYVVVMCYDEHTKGSEEAGSVASLRYVEKGLDDTLSEVPADQVIAALPFYTRLWQTEDGGTPDCTSYGMADAAAAVSSLGMETKWDENAGQYVGDMTVSGVRYQIWMEEEKSIEEKMKAVRARGLAGVAEWKLGFENDDIWSIISDYLK